MPKKNPYREQLKEDMGNLIEALEHLSPLQRQSLRSRWLEQVLWMEDRANGAQKRYYALRLTAIIGGVIVPALVGLKLSNPTVYWLTFGISLLVAISVAVEEFFHYGERWRHYRRTVELLKTEGWQFFEQSGPYEGKSHAEAYPIFTARVEDVIQHDIEAYFTNVVSGKEEEKKEGNTGDDIRTS